MYMIIKNVRYRIRFDYAIQEKDRKSYLFGGRALANLKGKRIFIFCDISIQKGIDENDNNKPIWHRIAGDYTIRNPEDVFLKASGRKTALSYTLKQIKDKNIRTSIWAEFFDSDLANYLTCAITQEEN